MPQRIISVTNPDDWGGYGFRSPAGEWFFQCWPIPFQLLDGANVEIRINITAYCTGQAFPAAAPFIRFRLGGSSLDSEDQLYVDDATHGVLLASFDLTPTFFLGPYFGSARPEYGQVNASHFQSVVTVSKPAARTKLRISSYANNTNFGCGMASCRVDFRGMP